MVESISLATLRSATGLRFITGDLQDVSIFASGNRGAYILYRRKSNYG
jgi:hypothetical protein